MGEFGEYEQSAAGVSAPATGPLQLAESEWHLAISTRCDERPGANGANFVEPDFGSVSDGVGDFGRHAVLRILLVPADVHRADQLGWQTDHPASGCGDLAVAGL